MNTRQYLQDARLIDVIEEHNRERILRLWARAERWTERRGSRKSDDAYAHCNSVAMLEAEIQAIQEQSALLIELKGIIDRSIAAVPNERYRGILEMRYLRRATWREIGSVLFLKRKWLWTLQNRSLIHIKIPPEYNVMRAKVCGMLKASQGRPARAAFLFLASDGGETTSP
ncbi:hypothetical protein ACH6CV_12140 [Bacillota bacterium Meth-B3]